MINFYNKSQNLIALFIILLILIIFEGFLCRPLSMQIMALNLYGPNKFCANNFFLSFWIENGFVENLQSLFLFFSIFFLIKAKLIYKDIKLINFFLIIKIILLIYFLGEEISWGQHFFNWSTPEWFINNNLQNETNIHNISNIFDQLPRSLVLMWCAFSVPIILILSKFHHFDKNLIKILCPDKNLKFISLLLLIFVLPDLIVDKFDLQPPHLDETSDLIHTINREAKFYDLITFNFLRLSELHEFIFAYYFLFYSLAISKINKVNH